MGAETWRTGVGMSRWGCGGDSEGGAPGGPQGSDLGYCTVLNAKTDRLRQVQWASDVFVRPALYSRLQETEPKS